MAEIRKVNITRYVTPLREGGSLPAIAEADDGFLYVLKFSGAGQGKRALVADFIGGLIARHLGLRVPEMVLASLDEAFGRTEADEEIQDLLKASTGLNLAFHYLQGAMTYDPAVLPLGAAEASAIVWLDSLILNVDRTAQNTNLLWWHRELWLIDHGAALYFHHSWIHWQEKAVEPFLFISNHVLLRAASMLEEADSLCRSKLSPEVFQEILDMVPDEWLEESPFPTISLHRAAYCEFLKTRLSYSPIFTAQAQDARSLI